MKYDIDSIKKRKKMNKSINKLIYVFVIILLYHIILVSVSYIDKFETPENYTYKAYIIVTDSMSPTINSGDMIVIKKRNIEDLYVGSIVTFKQHGQVVTHRITNIEEVDGVKQYTTKGDNNNVEDSVKIFYEDVEGAKVLTIPFLGKIMSVLKSGIVIVLGILLFLILAVNKVGKEEKRKIRREKKKDEERKSVEG